MLAVLRPSEWEWPLLVHVAGAMLLVGALVVAAAAMGTAVRGGDGAGALTRLGFRALLLGVIPAFVVMRAGAEWVVSEEDLPRDVDWVDIGYSVADGGLLLLLIATVLAWWASRRSAGDTGWPVRAALGLAAVLLAAYGVAIWAMTAKPA